MTQYHSINTDYLSNKKRDLLVLTGEAKTKIFGKIRRLREDEPKNPELTRNGFLDVAFI